MKESNVDADTLITSKLTLLSEIAALAMKNEFPTDEVAKKEYADNLRGFLGNSNTLLKKEGAFLDNFMVATIETIDKDILNKDSFAKLLEQHELDSSIKFLKDISKTEFRIQTKDQSYLIFGDGNYSPIEDDGTTQALIGGIPTVQPNFASKSQEQITQKTNDFSRILCRKFGVSANHINILRSFSSQQSCLVSNLANLQPDNNGVINYSLPEEYYCDADLKKEITIDLSKPSVVEMYYRDNNKYFNKISIDKTEIEIAQDTNKTALASTAIQDEFPNQSKNVKNNPTSLPNILDKISEIFARIYRSLFSSASTSQDQPSHEIKKEVIATLQELTIEEKRTLVNKSPLLDLDITPKTKDDKPSFVDAIDHSRKHPHARERRASI